MDPLTLVIPAFIAGILTFLAPCTLPLVPAYLSFISGTSAADLKKGNGRAKRKVLFNGFLFVLGFSAIFILLGSLFGLGGGALIQYREYLTRIGGVFVILFGLFLLVPALSLLTGRQINLPFFSFFTKERTPGFAKRLKPGNPASSFLFGSVFAAGWTPCVGPILGSILTLAASSATLNTGALLLLVFSLGLGIPFLLTALFLGWANEAIAKMGRALAVVSVVGGLFLIALGVFMVTDSFILWIAWFYRAFEFLNYEEFLLRFL